MARPERHDADYFPFYVKDGKTLFILESKYALQGIGFFTNLMRFLTRQTDHHICIADESDRLYFFAQLHCPEDIGIDMLNLMVKTGKIDGQLWDERRVIVSDDLLKSLDDAYKNRKNKIVTLEEIRVSYNNDAYKNRKNKIVTLEEIRVSYNFNPVSYQGNTACAVLSDENEGNNPQRKGKERKGKETKASEREIPPVDNSISKEAFLKEYQEIIKTVCRIFPSQYEQKQIALFVESHISNGNRDAMIHCLNSLTKAKQKETKTKPLLNPKAYLEDVFSKENGNYNEKENIAKSDAHKNDLTAIGDIFTVPREKSHGRSKEQTEP